MEKYLQAFENNKKWADEKSQQDKDFFKNLAGQQSPDFLFIGCSDSRVPPTVITGLEPGDMFVYRNIANVASQDDLSFLSVLQYAIEELHVKHIVVCGHYGCGGVKEAMGNDQSGLLDDWLNNIRTVQEINADSLEQISDETEKFDRLVELNVKEQCINVSKTEIYQKHLKKHGGPTIHGWVYDLNDGLLTDLKIDQKCFSGDSE